MPVHQYLDLFETKYAELLRSIRPRTTIYPSRRPGTSPWTAFARTIPRPSASPGLRFFAPEPIDWDIFSAVRGVAAPRPACHADDPIKLGRAVREIGRYALARIDHRKSTIQVHRLVQRVLIEQMNSAERGRNAPLRPRNPCNSDPRNPQRSLECPAIRRCCRMSGPPGWSSARTHGSGKLVLNESRFLVARKRLRGGARCRRGGRGNLAAAAR